MRTHKRRTYKKRTYKKYKRIYKRKNKSRSKKHFRGGGNWITLSDKRIENQPTCPICLESFSDTPNKAIYMSNCGHLFHNDCLFDECEHKNGEALCPLCRSDLDTDCMDVWAFKNKSLGNIDQTPLFNGNNEILNIYHNQP